MSAQSRQAPPDDESDALHARVQAFVRASLGGRAEGFYEGFDALALDLARFQARRVASFARLVRARGVDLDGATSAADIPAVPTDVFKLARVAAHPADRDVALFRTSGTTITDRGEHAFRTTTTYELVAMEWGRRWLWPDGARLRTLVLAPTHADQPDSSLGFMLDRFARAQSGSASWHVGLDARDKTKGAHLDREGIARAAGDARATGQATLVLATSFALVHLVDDRGDADLRLPPGSRVMQTGGFKGRSREVAPAELRALLAETFGVPEAHVVSEYGMTELSSQLYEETLANALGFAARARHGVYAAPPWVRLDAVDPVSLTPLAPGEVGLARIVDLANVDSAVAIQTADRVRVLGGGRVELLGRMPGATPRGCSIAIDAMLGGA